MASQVTEVLGKSTPVSLLVCHSYADLVGFNSIDPTSLLSPHTQTQRHIFSEKKVFRQNIHTLGQSKHQNNNN
ncbi:hypothetical protein QVD17_11796 [Tagetes erecta]|uniref:Uncharacterized protein n=1 Tax=Tagetes erecta TaxID=13708 RepID=A0AAD8L099_TARER|nr:hypothetical protein QVD17_11796 [Tagetes erecta]